MAKSTLADTEFSWEHVIYIGMTATSLKKRLNQFNRAIQGERGHSDGNTLYAKNRGNVDSGQIYVAMMGLECDVEKRKPCDSRILGNVVYLEYEAFAQFSEATGRAKPQINKQ